MASGQGPGVVPEEMGRCRRCGRCSRCRRCTVGGVRGVGGVEVWKVPMEGVESSRALARETFAGAGSRSRRGNGRSPDDLYV